MKTYLILFLSVFFVLITSLLYADDYKVNEDGEITFLSQTIDSFDRLIAANKNVHYKKNGSPIQQFISIKKDILNNSKRLEEKRLRKKYSGLKLDFHKDAVTAINVFEFLADHTYVEWSLLTFGIGQETRTHIYTSFENDVEYFGARRVFRLLRSPKLVASITHYHNHPRYPVEAEGKYAFPSNQDINFRDYILRKKIPQVAFKIRTDRVYLDYGNPREWHKGNNEPALF